MSNEPRLRREPCFARNPRNGQPRWRHRWIDGCCKWCGKHPDDLKKYRPRASSP